MKIIKKIPKLLFLVAVFSWPVFHLHSKKRRVKSCNVSITRYQTELIPWSPNFSSLPKQSRVQTISNAPYILCIHDFLSDEEAEHLKEIALPLLAPSIVVGKDQVQSTSANRTSRSAFLHMVSSEMVSAIRKRAADFVNTTVDSVEHLQVVHYKDSQRYDPHYDYFDRTLASAKSVIGTQGQRIATLLVYLNDVGPDSGGQTIFPKVLGGLKIKPKKGMAVFWYNVLPDGKEDDRTLHGGLPIQNDEKWATNIWIRDPRLTFSECLLHVT